MAAESNTNMLHGANVPYLPHLKDLQKAILAKQMDKVNTLKSKANLSSQLLPLTLLGCQKHSQLFYYS